MHRVLIAAVLTAFMATFEVALPISANQAQPEAWRAAIAQAGFPVPADLRYRMLADGTIFFDGNMVKVPHTRQQTLQVFNPASKRITEVFPGTSTSPHGAMVMKRIEDLFARVGEADRAALLADEVGAGFDRSITSWRADPAGGSVAVAVYYSRDRLSKHLGMQLSDDYGRPDPIDLAEFEFFTVGVCSRTPAETWNCQEQELAALAKKHSVALPNDRAGRNAAAEKLLELVLVK
jgi:hypothetical protein